MTDSPIKLSPNITRLGIIADLHGGLAEDADARLDAFLTHMKNANVDALVQLGDFAYPNPKHQRFPDKFNQAHDQTVHVIGNHEFDFGLNRNHCIKAWGIPSPYYRKDIAGLRILVLDGNEKGSPSYKAGYHSYIGKDQQQWLAAELDLADRPVLIFSHQPLAGTAAIDNCKELQTLLGRFADKIVMCLNGHSHVDSLIRVKNVTYLHINSASYYWVGGKQRMAGYQHPLFTTLTFDSSNDQVTLEGKHSDWKPGESPHRSGYFERETAPPETIVTPSIRERSFTCPPEQTSLKNYRVRHHESPTATAASDVTTLKVMTWNIWGKLNQDPRYTVNNQTARERTIDVIRASKADVIAMIETYGSAKEIANALDFHHYTPDEDANLCIFSRYPLSDFEPLTGLSPFSFIGATVTLPNDQQVRIYDIWLTSGGRHIVEIKNAQLDDQAFCAGDDLRYDMLAKFLKHPDLKKHMGNIDNVPVIVAGDFNCVSHLDHFAATRDAGLNHSRILATKVSKAMHAAGFNDTFRQANPDILPSTLGHTWTTVGQGYVYESGKGFVPVEQNPQPEYRDPYTRIDFIYSAGQQLIAAASQVISHHPSQTKRSFPEFPSDHAAVLTEFRL